MKTIPTIYYTVLRRLEEDERCRNEDQYLVCKVWTKLHPHKFEKMTFKGREGALVIDLRSIANDFESFETIRRTRQKIQNDLGLFPPTLQSVAKGRRMKEEEWRENCRNNFTLPQAEAIMEVWMKAKGASKKNLEEIKRQALNKII